MYSRIMIRESELFVLPDQDSNLDKRYQKPSYYLYTIGQSSISVALAAKWNANIARLNTYPKHFFVFDYIQPHFENNSLEINPEKLNIFCPI